MGNNTDELPMIFQNMGVQNIDDRWYLTSKTVRIDLHAAAAAAAVE